MRKEIQRFLDEAEVLRKSLEDHDPDSEVIEGAGKPKYFLDKLGDSVEVFESAVARYDKAYEAHQKELHAASNRGETRGAPLNNDEANKVATISPVDDEPTVEAQPGDKTPDPDNPKLTDDKETGPKDRASTQGGQGGGQPDRGAR